VSYEFHDNPDAVYTWSEPVYTSASTSPEAKK